MAPAVGVDDTRIPLHLLKEMFQRSSDMFSVIGMDSRIHYVNPAWTEVLGWSRDDLLGSMYLDLVHPDDLQETQNETRNLANEGYTTRRFNNRNRTKDGGIRWCRWNAVSDVGLGCIFAIGRDVTAEVEARGRARELEQDFMDFTYRTCHDLVSPLNAANMLLHVARMKAEGTDLSGSLQKVQDALVSVFKLVESLRRMAVIEHGAAALAVPLDKAARDVEQILQPQLQREGATMEWHDLPVVNLHADNARHLFMNLVENSLKYRSDRPPHIELDGSSCGNGVARVLVRDNGRGIPEQQWESIFRTGFRGEQKESGSGLGLAICRRIVERASGSIRVLESSDQGTTFEILLPQEADS